MFDIKTWTTEQVLSVNLKRHDLVTDESSALIQFPDHLILDSTGFTLQTSSGTELIIDTEAAFNYQYSAHPCYLYKVEARRRGDTAWFTVATNEIDSTDVQSNATSFQVILNALRGGPWPERYLTLTTSPDGAFPLSLSNWVDTDEYLVYRLAIQNAALSKYNSVDWVYSLPVDVHSWRSLWTRNMYGSELFEFERENDDTDLLPILRESVLIDGSTRGAVPQTYVPRLFTQAVKFLGDFPPNSTSKASALAERGLLHFIVRESLPTL